MVGGRAAHERVRQSYINDPLCRIATLLPRIKTSGISLSASACTRAFYAPELIMQMRSDFSVRPTPSSSMEKRTPKVYYTLIYAHDIILIEMVSFALIVPPKQGKSRGHEIRKFIPFIYTYNTPSHTVVVVTIHRYILLYPRGIAITNIARDDYNAIGTGTQPKTSSTFLYTHT